MPCSKASITKTYKCDKEGCVCIPTKGAARVCMSVNETGDIVRCDCACDTKCECNENCTCINTAGLTCICVCRDQNGRIKTCEDCSCQPEQAQNQSCKGKSNVTCCCNTGNEKCAGLNCSCCEPGKNKCGKGSCVTTCKGKKAASGCECKRKSKCDCNGTACESKQVDGFFKTTKQPTNCCGNCDEKCKCFCVDQEDAFNDNVCVRNACSGNCKCQGNANSCVCICKNKQGETVCCDDCKCDGNNRCDKEGCVCIRKESTSTFKSVKINCCENCDEKCKCSCVEQNAAIRANNCARKACSENCKCPGNANSCVCICKNKQGETVCCDDCKCDNNNICDKEGCVCVPKKASYKGETLKSNCRESCDANRNCAYLDQKAVFNVNSCAGKVYVENCKCQGNRNSCVCICENDRGERICCNDCECDDNNTCDKKGCVCVPRGTVTCKNTTTFKSSFCCNAVRSSICICKNKQGFVCCYNCKCDGTNTCDRKACTCVRKASSDKTVKTNCCDNCKERCTYVEQNAAIKSYNCAGKVCSENCKCKANVNSCVCICKNKQGETVCCDDCKCDSNNICDKEGCVCVPTKASYKGDTLKKSNCCENCDAKCKCSCVGQAVFNANSCARKVCAENCKCQGNTNSCVCVCKNKQGEIWCYDCKCISNQKCDNKGCTCIPSASVTCNNKTEPKCCC